jgi:hypothetical protein
MMTNRRWSKPELDILYHFEYRVLTNKKMSAMLANRGYERSERAVASKRARDGILEDVDLDQETLGYTPNGLAKALGLNHTTVMRFVNIGLMKAKAQNPNGIKKITRINRKEIRKFLINYQEHWDHRKTDQYWLIDILTRT